MTTEQRSMIRMSADTSPLVLAIRDLCARQTSNRPVAVRRPPSFARHGLDGWLRRRLSPDPVDAFFTGVFWAWAVMSGALALVIWRVTT